MTVQEAIAAAEALLPGRAAPDGRIDPRWQAIIAVGEFIETEPDAVWLFIRRWGRSTNADLRSAVATCLLEHLLENHFDRFIPLVEQAALEDQLFADTVCQCSKFGRKNRIAPFVSIGWLQRSESGLSNSGCTRRRPSFDIGCGRREGAACR